MNKIIENLCCFSSAQRPVWSKIPLSEHPLSINYSELGCPDDVRNHPFLDIRVTIHEF